MNRNDDNHYGFVEKYWNNRKSNLEGMIGFEKLDLMDVIDSRKTLKDLFGETGGRRVLDCGCGIGRITEKVLMRFFDRIDCVDISGKHLDCLKRRLSSEKIENIYEESLHKFIPKPDYYDCIWIQWVILYLNDEDAKEFLMRCGRSLRKDGKESSIILKVNVARNDDGIYDKDDRSFVRSHKQFHSLFSASNLIISYEKEQPHYPSELFPLYSFVLHVNDNGIVNSNE
ncbi:hypothetical protein SNEBB_000366 [Seison nebaliae]|nr:hypothetical protein SNEBB_000366 [Seison nebaliae]